MPSNPKGKNFVSKIQSSEYNGKYLPKVLLLIIINAIIKKGIFSSKLDGIKK
jgi:hypothetical protein